MREDPDLQKTSPGQQIIQPQNPGVLWVGRDLKTIQLQPSPQAENLSLSPADGGEQNQSGLGVELGAEAEAAPPTAPPQGSAPTETHPGPENGTSSCCFYLLTPSSL